MIKINSFPYVTLFQKNKLLKLIKFIKQCYNNSDPGPKMHKSKPSLEIL